MGKHSLKIFGLALLCLFVTALLLQPGGLTADADRGEPQTAEALEVQAITVVPRLAAYGQARPSRVWAAVAQADSRLAWVSPKIMAGEQVEKGEELLHLVEYKLAPDSAQATPQTNIIRAPFKGLATAAEIKAGHEIASGKTILTLDSLDQAEITIGLNSEKLAMLANVEKSDGVVVTTEIRDSLSQAWVEVAAEGGSERQPARLSSRPVSVNPGTGLVEASLLVDNLSAPGALHQVFISGQPRAGQVVIPRNAIHDGEVLVVDGKQRLKKRQVTVRYTLDNYAVIGRGLEPGETLIIGDVGSLKPGGRLDLRLDDNFYLAAQNVLGPGAPLRPAANPDGTTLPLPGQSADAATVIFQQLSRIEAQSPLTLNSAGELAGQAGMAGQFRIVGHRPANGLT